MSSNPLTAFSSGETDRNESDHVTRQSEPRCFGLLRHTIALKRQWIWLAAWPKHSVPALFAHAQISPEFVFDRLEVTRHLDELKWFIYCLKECWNVWERTRHAGISAVWGQRVYTCEVQLVQWVIWGVVEVRGQLHSCALASRRPAGFSPALSLSNATQEDCGNVCALNSSHVAVFGLLMFFLGLKYSWCHL